MHTDASGSSAGASLHKLGFAFPAELLIYAGDFDCEHIHCTAQLNELYTYKKFQCEPHAMKQNESARSFKKPGAVRYLR